jgi:P-type E1-E2 ATPase
MEENIEVTVIRDSKEFLIKQSELLVGDVIILSGGDSIPVDCLVIEANLQAQVDESYLTPDINPVQKRTIKIFEETIEKGSGENKQNDEEIDTPDPFLLASTLVIAGRMKALV